jgi:hypothetical protein
MSEPTIRILIAIFFILHGLVHISLTFVPVPAPGAPRVPFWPSWWRPAVDPQWSITRLGVPHPLVRTLGWILWLAALIGFVLAGLGLLGFPGLDQIWQSTAIFGSISSLLLLVLYWHRWLFVALFINAAVLLAILQQSPRFLFD